MAKKVSEASPAFMWSQPSLKFALTDLRRNWPRWFLWAGLFAGFVAILNASSRRPQEALPDPLILYPALFTGCLAYQFLAAFFLSRVEVHPERIILGFGRNTRRYDFKKISDIRFTSLAGSPSMLLGFKSGKQIEVFLNPTQVQTEELMKYLTAAGAPVSAA